MKKVKIAFQGERGAYSHIACVNKFKDVEVIEILIKSNNNFSRRQDAPSVFDITTVSYVCRPEFIINSDAIFDGKVKGVQIPADRALDIDTELDWKFVEFMMDKKIISKVADIISI